MNDSYNLTDDYFNQTSIEDVVYPAESVRVVIISIFGLLSTFSVILTYLTFYKQLGNKITYTILFWMFVSDFIYSMGSVVGYQNETNFACVWLGLVTNIGTLSNVFWSILLAYLLYTIIKGEKFVLRYYHHIICWGLSIFLTLIPYSNARYGSNDNDEYIWCWIKNTDDSPEWAGQLWFWLSYYFWIWLAIASIIVLYIASFIKVRFNKKASEQTISNFYSTLYSICGYQITVVVIWALMCTADFYSYYFYEESLTNEVILNIYLWAYDLAIGIGVLHSIYFWYYNKYCRKLWYDFYKAGFSRKKFLDNMRKQTQMTNIASSNVESNNASTKKYSTKSQIILTKSQIIPTK